MERRDRARWSWGTLAVAGWVFAANGSACSVAGPAAQPADAPATVVVTRGELEERLVLTGAVDAKSSAEFPVPRTDDWQITIKWMAEDGSLVKPGDRVVEFDNGAVVERVGELELAMLEAGTELDSQAAKVAVAVAEKSFAVQTQQNVLDKARLDASVPERLLSRREAQDVRLAVVRAEVALATAQDDLRAAREGGKLEIEVKQIAYDKAARSHASAREQLETMVSTAQTAGVFVVADHPWEGRKLQVGDNVWPGFSIGKLPDRSRMVVDASLSDVDDGRIHQGMRVTCTVDAFPDRPLAGTITGINPVAHEASRESLRRFFAVVIELDESDPEVLRPGMSVKVDIVSRTSTDVLLVPRELLSFTTDEVLATREDGSTTAVTVDACNAMQCAVASGLNEGDTLRPPEAS